MTLNRSPAILCHLALALILSGCATRYIPQQELMTYSHLSDAESYPVAFDISYSPHFPGQKSLAVIQHKLPNSPTALLPYQVELQYRRWVNWYWIDMRIWSAGEVVLEETIHARQRGMDNRGPEFDPDPISEFYHAAAAHFAQFINERLRDDYPHYAEALAADTETAWRMFLANNRASLLYHAGLSALANHGPDGKEGMAWHLANKSAYPGYVMALPQQLRLWLAGPEGFSFWELQMAVAEGRDHNQLLEQTLAAHAFDLPDITTNERYGVFDFEAHMGGPQYSPAIYRHTWDDTLDNNTNWHQLIHTNLINQYRFRHQSRGIGIPISESESLKLQQEGLSEHLIAAANLHNEDYGQPFTLWRQGRLSPEEYVHTLRIDDTSGRYLSPYTEDEVVAEWVNRAINARIGATAGSTAGAIAGAELGRNLPVPGGQFLGSVLGSAAGQSSGRGAAIQALGGWDFIRAHSDYSFASLRDMAEYLHFHFGDRQDFMDVVNATSAIYPGLQREIETISR